MKSVTIIDYGVGNLQSLKKAFARVGANAQVSEDAQEIEKADALVLPGVGAFASGMRGLALRGLLDAVKEFARSGKPMLGICLGAQLLLSEGHEFEVHEGLGIIPGTVVLFPPLSGDEKIPQVGWNTVCRPSGVSWNGTIFESFRKELEVYFVHSYILKPERSEHMLGTTRYGGLPFCSALRSGRIFGTQFHPEKSGEAGLQIMRDFVKLIQQ